MSTQITHNGQPVATRICTASGPVLMMAMTQSEWSQWRDVAVESESGQQWDTAEQMVVEMSILVAWDDATQRNKRARQLQDHRWLNHPTVGDALRTQMSIERQHARHAVRDQMTVV